LSRVVLPLWLWHLVSVLAVVVMLIWYLSRND
jgi:hypothetical protein